MARFGMTWIIQGQMMKYFPGQPGCGGRTESSLVENHWYKEKTNKYKIMGDTKYKNFYTLKLVSEYRI